jgi:protease-4
MKTSILAIIGLLVGTLGVARTFADDGVTKPDEAGATAQTQTPPATPEKKPASPPNKQPATTPEKNPQAPTDKPSPAKEKKSGPPPSESEFDSKESTTAASASAKSNDAEPAFPTPADLIKRLQKEKAARAALTKVVHFDLASAVVEKPAEFSLFGDSTANSLRSVVQRMQMARDDKDVRAVLLTLGEPSLNFAQAQELRDALIELRKAGKKTFVYSDSYDTVTYTLATGATNVCLMEGGEIMIPGVGMETMFYKGLFDKVGVQADYVQIGEYKGAEEPYTRSTASEPLKGELTKLADSMYQQIVDGISENRNLPPDTVRQMIDDTMMSAKVAKERGFVDHLVDFHGLKDLITQEMGNGLNVVSNFGQPQREQLDFSNPLALLSSLGKKNQEQTSKPSVALLYAEGTIVDGDGGESLLGGSSGVGSAMLRRTLRRAAADDNVKAIVIRIDSPGGSAQASEVMWQAARAAAQKKPVIVSVGSMAASGGYYLASAGDYIYADPSAIVGSIGVVGGKFVLKDLYDKLGLTTESFTKGRNAGLFSSNHPFDERQRRLVTNWMKNTYDQFTQRVMSTRSGKIKDIDKVARGRIFLATQAKELGMVDEIGGVQNAIAHAANKAGLQTGQYDVKILPQPRTLADMLMGSGAEAEMPVNPKVSVDVQLGELSLVLKSLDPTTRKALDQQLELIQILQRRPVALVAPFVVTVR